MSCIFCGDNTHFSQYCNIYVSNEDRKIILFRTNTCCTYCFKTDCRLMHDCFEYKRKCYICFTKNHHTVYCPNRFTVPEMFPPNIDTDLLPRFIGMLMFEELYPMTFSYPKILNVVKIKPVNLKSVYTVDLADIDSFIDLNVIVADKGLLSDKRLAEYLFKLQVTGVHRTAAENQAIVEILKQMTFLIEHIQIQYISSFSSDIFLHFLSTKTISLECTFGEFVPKLKFQDIILHAPNLKIIDLDGTNVEFGDTWPEDLLRSNHILKLEKLCFTITNLNFSAKSLAILMKKKPISISLIFVLPRYKMYDKQEIAAMVIPKFFPYFIRVDPEQSLQISISYVYNPARYTRTEIFNMKIFLAD